MDIPVIKVLTPDLTVSEPKKYAVIRGPTQLTQYAQVSNSYNTSAINFNFSTPSKDAIIKRNFLLEMSVQLDFVGTGIGNLIQLGVNDAPRAFPIMQCMNSINAVIDNATISTNNLPDFQDALMRYYLTPERKAKYQGLTPVMSDQFQQYDDALIHGFSRSPLNSYGNSSEMEDARGGFIGIEVLSNTNTTASVRLTLREPLLFTPPFLGEAISEDMGFVNCDQFTFTFNLSDLSNMWSHSSAGNTISSITPSFFAAPKLIYSVATAPLTMKIPDHAKYPYYTVVRFANSDLTLTPGSSSQVQYQNIQLNGIPNKVFLFAYRRPQDRSFLTSNSYASIEQCNIQFNNVTGILSSSTKEQLYTICVENGLQMTYNQWSKYVGSVLCLEFGKDIFLNDTEAPGKRGNYQLQPTVTFKNNSSSTVVYTPYAVVVSEGIFHIESSGLKRQEISPLTTEMILNAQESDMKFSSVERTEGGSFKDWLPLIGQAVKVGGPIASQVIGDIMESTKSSGGALISKEELRRKR